MNKNEILVAAFFLAQIHLAQADYFVTGQIEGNVCHGFGIEWCRFHKIAAVKDGKGQLYEVKTRYESVGEYNENDKRCWVNTKSKGAGVVSWVANVRKNYTYLEKNSSGGYEELDVEYLTFPCTKR